ncbi:hypothetical protein L1987_23339 [Smallanthus sonchifolius]|uniref:Uncharacterized protein n=1 Tax=Smallanthus sonchifolius TaxID=185202 RepID=A0ACB9IH65_9ASTR|nr:hypothetical protein L1987_23339 [Smallanthus sonchifolius]
MLTAGTETPYLTLEWSMSLLLNNPNAMEKIKNEIDTHVGSDRLLQESALDKLSYLLSVINESLRLYPTLPLLLPREASDDIKTGGYSVPRGTMLMVNAWTIQRDPVLWDEPDKFMPERFDRRGEDKYKMLAFSVGRRGCPRTNLGVEFLRKQVENFKRRNTQATAPANLNEDIIEDGIEREHGPLTLRDHTEMIRLRLFLHQEGGVDFQVLKEFSLNKLIEQVGVLKKSKEQEIEETKS